MSRPPMRFMAFALTLAASATLIGAPSSAQTEEVIWQRIDDTSRVLVYGRTRAFWACWRLGKNATMLPRLEVKRSGIFYAVAAGTLATSALPEDVACPTEYPSVVRYDWTVQDLRRSNPINAKATPGDASGSARYSDLRQSASVRSACRAPKVPQTHVASSMWSHAGSVRRASRAFRPTTRRDASDETPQSAAMWPGDRVGSMPRRISAVVKVRKTRIRAEAGAGARHPRVRRRCSRAHPVRLRSRLHPGLGGRDRLCDGFPEQCEA